MNSAVKTIAAAAALSLAAAAADAKTLIMALDRAGTFFNASGSGVAKVASEHTKHRVIVRAFGGPDVFMPAVNEGKYDFSTVSSSTSWYDYNGKNSSKTEYKNLRIIRSGAGALKLGFAVYADSDIKKVSDLKGKRVTSDFGGHSVIGPMVTATLNAFGLTWDDVKQVPVTGALDAPRALGAERVDATWASLGMPVVREIHAKRKVRYLDFGSDPKTLEQVQKATFPGVRMTQMPPLKHLGLPAPTHLLVYDSYVVTHKNQDPQIVHDVLEGLWEHTKELQKAHISLRGFTHETAATDLPMIPYHPAAIEFYKEKGVWTDKVQAAHEKVK